MINGNALINNKTFCESKMQIGADAQKYANIKYGFHLKFKVVLTDIIQGLSSVIIIYLSFSQSFTQYIPLTFISLRSDVIKQQNVTHKDVKMASMSIYIY